MSKRPPDRIYSNLNISQRIRAAWSASQRDDQAEIERLKSPNEAGEYVISRVSAALNDLNVISMAAHLDVLNAVIGHLIAVIRLEHAEDPEEASKIKTEALNAAKIPSQIATALSNLCESIGIEKDSILSPNSLPPIAQSLIERHSDTPREKLSFEYEGTLIDYLRSRHPKIACFQPA